MKLIHPLPLSRRLSILTLAFAIVGALTFGPSHATAQSTEKTISGYFKFSNGDKGTYVTNASKTDTGGTEQTVFTRTSDGLTSTDTTTTIRNDDGTRTVNFSHNDFGTTAQFVSTKTITREKHGEAAGTGTYTTAEGVSGTLTTLETHLDHVVAVDSTHASSTGTTSELRIEDSELGFKAVKVITLNPDGTVSTEVRTRYITHISS